MSTAHNGGRTWDTVAVLADPVRRALYEHVRRQDHPVTREEAADAVAISRNLSAFHLDKLVDAGLLRARYESPPDRQGPGRTPKVYEPAGDGVNVSLPARQYGLVGQILADAVAEHSSTAARAADSSTAPRAADPSTGASTADPSTAASAADSSHAPDSNDAASAARRHATALGRQLGVERAGQSAEATLAELGFEPTHENHDVVLDNCPFHALAQRHTALICGINHAFVEGLLDGLGEADQHAELHPRSGGCCVRLKPEAYG